MYRTLLKLVRRRKLQVDLETELAFHRDMAAAHGNPIPLGNTAVLKEEALDLWRFNVIENLWRDLVYAARALRRSPAFLFTALVSLSLGIGANAAIFSLVVEFLISKPSVSDPSTIASIRFAGNSHSQPEVLEAVRSSGAIQELAGEREESMNFNDGRDTRRLFAIQATKNYFTMLGIPLALGRGWAAGDPDEVVVLSHRVWMRELGGDSSVIGGTMRLDDKVQGGVL